MQPGTNFPTGRPLADDLSAMFSRFHALCDEAQARSDAYAPSRRPTLSRQYSVVVLWVVTVFGGFAIGSKRSVVSHDRVHASLSSYSL